MSVIDIADVQRLLPHAPNKTDGVRFSGTLSQLDLYGPGLTTTDCGRIVHIIKATATDDGLKRRMIGIIVVNIDECSAHTAGLKRANTADVLAIGQQSTLMPDDRDRFASRLRRPATGCRAATVCGKAQADRQ